MELGERKKKILAAIVESFIETAEPVGSRTIAKIGRLDLSSATIRNEMADLEDLGLLEQPHTSAGRIPSHKGYRIYVDRLMKKHNLSTDEITCLKALMGLKIANLDILIKEITDIYSKITKYALIGTMPEDKKTCIKHFQLMPVSQNELLMVIVTSGNVVKDTKLHVDTALDIFECAKISSVLNDNLTGISCNEINIDIIEQVNQQLAENKSILRQILQFIYDCIEANDNAEVFHHGLTNLLNFPEYRDISRAKRLLDFLTDKVNLQKAFAGAYTFGDNKDLQIIIGDENREAELKECSVVLSSYHIDGEFVGTIGFIGPTRMNYSKAVSDIKFLTEQLDQLSRETWLESFNT
ncbi:MAG: heat-inducible transcription repressor HrcA [Clostridiaceae bacterium]|jgi:heat-inducible transcriptional repressor|nr:heat-inducible transcription repressor HrcA [Clostridiaceae bacterium]